MLKGIAITICLLASFTAIASGPTTSQKEDLSNPSQIGLAMDVWGDYYPSDSAWVMFYGAYWSGFGEMRRGAEFVRYMYANDFLSKIEFRERMISLFEKHTNDFEASESQAKRMIFKACNTIDDSNEKKLFCLSQSISETNISLLKKNKENCLINESTLEKRLSCVEELLDNHMEITKDGAQ